jgi:diguanylate cyclase (GGDEF)-like protein
MDRASEQEASQRDDPATMARILAILLFLGAATGALTLVLPHAPNANETALWSNVALAGVAALAVALAASRIKPWMLQVVLVFGTLAITRAIYFSGDAGSFYSMWYVWVGLFAFFALERSAALAQLGVTAAAYGWVLTEIPQGSPVVRWLMTVGTIAIGGVLVDILMGRVRARAEAARSRAHLLEVVAATAHELARHTTSKGAGGVICRAAVEAVGANSASLWQPTSDGRGLAKTATSPPGETGQVISFLEARSEAAEAFVSSKQSVAEGALYEPLVLDEVTVGVLAVHWPADHPSLAVEELSQVMDLLALEGSLALQRAETLARLERVARTDDLTGLANRRAWDEHLEREIAWAKRSGTPLAVGILDLDHFKQFNDRHGHPAGDRMLKAVSASWERAIRATDILARYGGEEFALVMPATEADEALAILERLRSAMPTGQRVSAGLVCWDGSEDEAAIVGRADAALYAAKAAGRDRVLTG